LASLEVLFGFTNLALEVYYVLATLLVKFSVKSVILNPDKPSKTSVLGTSEFINFIGKSISGPSLQYYTGKVPLFIMFPEAIRFSPVSNVPSPETEY